MVPRPGDEWLARPSDMPTPTVASDVPTLENLISLIPVQPGKATSCGGPMQASSHILRSGHLEYKTKVKLPLAMKERKRSGCKNPRLPDFGIRWTWLVFTLWSIYSSDSGSNGPMKVGRKWCLRKRKKYKTGL